MDWKGMWEDLLKCEVWYSRQLDLAELCICSSGVLLGMIWVDERRKNSLGEMGAQGGAGMGSTNTAWLLLGWMWLIFLHPVDKHTCVYLVMSPSMHTHTKGKRLRDAMQQPVGFCYFSSASRRRNAYTPTSILISSCSWLHRSQKSLLTVYFCVVLVCF